MNVHEVWSVLGHSFSNTVYEVGFPDQLRRRRPPGLRVQCQEVEITVELYPNRIENIPTFDRRSH